MQVLFKKNEKNNRRKKSIPWIQVEKTAEELKRF